MMTATGMIIMVVAATGTGKSEPEPVVACAWRRRLTSD